MIMNKRGSNLLFNALIVSDLNKSTFRPFVPQQRSSVMSYLCKWKRKFCYLMFRLHPLRWVILSYSSCSIFSVTAISQAAKFYLTYIFNIITLVQSSICSHSPCQAVPSLLSLNLLWLVTLFSWCCEPLTIGPYLACLEHLIWSHYQSSACSPPHLHQVSESRGSSDYHLPSSGSLLYDIAFHRPKPLNRLTFCMCTSFLTQMHRLKVKIKSSQWNKNEHLNKANHKTQRKNDLKKAINIQKQNTNKSM